MLIRKIDGAQRQKGISSLFLTRLQEAKKKPECYVEFIQLSDLSRSPPSTWTNPNLTNPKPKPNPYPNPSPNPNPNLTLILPPQKKKK